MHENSAKKCSKDIIFMLSLSKDVHDNLII